MKKLVGYMLFGFGVLLFFMTPWAFPLIVIYAAGKVAAHCVELIEDDFR